MEGPPDEDIDEILRTLEEDQFNEALESDLETLREIDITNSASQLDFFVRSLLTAFGERAGRLCTLRTSPLNPRSLNF